MNPEQKSVLRWLLIWLLIAPILAACCFLAWDAVFAQDDNQQLVFTCLKLNEVKLTAQYWVLYPDIKNDTIKREYTPDFWQNFNDMQGQGFWVGYDRGGFDWPDDVYIYGQVWFPVENSEPRQVLFYFSPQTADQFYMLPFVSIQPYADTNGQHYGNHPCGAYVVKLEALKPLLPDMVASVQKYHGD